MRSAPPVLVCAFLLASCVADGSGSQPAAVPGRTALRSWTFEDGLPAGFEIASGGWERGTEEQRRAPSGTGVVLQTARSAPSAFNVLLADGVGRDVDLSVKLRAREGEVDQGGGLVWRARDGRNYYIARWNPLEDNFRLYEVVDGRRQELASASVSLDSGQWHAMRVRMVGTRIECWLDGRALLQASDDTFFEAGRVGLWTKADARTAFDDLELHSIE